MKRVVTALAMILSLLVGTALTGTLSGVGLPAALTRNQMPASPARVPDEPEVRWHDQMPALTLRAVRDQHGRSAFAFDGRTVPPVIRVAPGATLRIRYVNDLPPHSHEQCAGTPCMNMTNLHFHGLVVSPRGRQDDVLNMLAMPGQTLEYSVQVPRDHPPGLYWYHPHPHGESQRQVLDGMSGAMVIEGIDRYVPEVRGLRERVLMLRGRDIEHAADAASLISRVGIPQAPCGAATERPERVFTVNGVVRPAIPLAPGERQFWRIVNASADSYADVQLDGQPLEIVALDGVPLAYRDPQRRTRPAGHVLLPPAGRLEAIVTGPPAGTPTVLRTRCVDTGPDGDANPEMVLADVVPAVQPPLQPHPAPVDERPAVHRPARVADLEKSPPQFVVTFTEDKHGFYINGQKYASDADPMVRVRVGSYQHWRVVNATREVHPFHIHQAHFLAYAENDVRLPQSAWLDTVNVPAGGSVDVIMDFTDPVIRGMSVFHCHLLNHEDKGMMAKILFE